MLQNIFFLCFTVWKTANTSLFKSNWDNLQICSKFVHEVALGSFPASLWLFSWKNQYYWYFRFIFWNLLPGLRQIWFHYVVLWFLSYIYGQMYTLDKDRSGTTYLHMQLCTFGVIRQVNLGVTLICCPNGTVILFVNWCWTTQFARQLNKGLWCYFCPSFQYLQVELYLNWIGSYIDWVFINFDNYI